MALNSHSPALRAWLPRLSHIGIALLAALMALPVLVVVGFVAVPSGEVWSHLAATVLSEYVQNTLLLMIGVAAGTLLIGVTAAWLTAMCQFPGRGLFEWALLLPLAMPAYIIAYTYTGMLDVAGPVQTSLRAFTGWQYGDYPFPDIRSIEGAAIMLTLVLYPYVYLLTRAAFLNQSICVLDVSRTLGNGPWRTFWTVALPLARPAIIAGLSLALMETIADFGTVQYFGVPTFTTGIFRTWFGFGNPAAAAQLAASLLGFVVLLVLAERFSRRQARFHHTSRRQQVIRRMHLSALPASLAVIFCVGVLTLGFVLPTLQLLSWTLESANTLMQGTFWQLVWNSFKLAAIAAILAMGIALLLAYAQRATPTPFMRFAVRTASLGYAIPGAVIAVGVMIPFAFIDHRIDALFSAQFGISTGLLLSGTLIALVFGYLARFLSVSLQTLESGLGKITPSMDEAARSCGFGLFQRLKRVHMPLLQGSMLTALLLVFVDVLKELPATLILRPFNFNTLAVKAYELASDERLAEAAPAALAILAVGILPVILISWSITRSRPTL